MARTINVEINGQFVKKDSKNGGVMGEGNVTAMHITFDGSWTGYGKRIVWRDANGENPVSVVLFEPIEATSGQDPLSTDTTIPAEPLAVPGWCSFSIEGYKEEDGVHKVSFSVSDHLFVEESDSYNKPAEPTPSQTQQIFEELGKVTQEVQTIATEAKSWAVGGTGSREGEDTDNSKYYSQTAGESAESADQSAQSAEESAESAKNDADRAQRAASSPPYIGENGNWYCWDVIADAYKDTGIPATALYDTNSKKPVRVWFGTVQEYNSLDRIEPDVYYNILEGTP